MNWLCRLFSTKSKINQLFHIVASWAILANILYTCKISVLAVSPTASDVCRCSYIYQRVSKNAPLPPVAPWEAVILRSDKKDKDAAPKKMCSGSILNDKMILTSVSCAKKSRFVGVPIEQAKRSAKPILKETDMRSQQELTTDNLHVWLGVRNDTLINETGGRMFSVDQIHIHPNFVETFGTIADWDYAILILKESIEFSKYPNLSPACLLPSDFQLELRGQRVRTHFWKFTEPAFDIDLKELVPTQFASHLTTSYLFPNEQCKSKALKKEWISDRYICHSEGRMTTTGSGHFIELRNGFPVLVGIGSYQSLYGTPGVHDFKQIALISRLADGRQFIDDKVSSLASWTCSATDPELIPPANGYSDRALDDLEPYEFGTRPWYQFTSEYRRLLPPPAEDGGCRCGIKKSTSQSSSSKLGRIWRGRDVETLYEYPWHCNGASSVSHYGTFACGGSIINNRLILTAAHCLGGKNGGTLARAKCRGKNSFIPTKSNDTYALYFQFEGRNRGVLIHPVYGRLKGTGRNGTLHEYQASAVDLGMLVFNETLELGNVPDIGAVCLPYSGEDLEIDGKQAILVGNGRGLHDGKITVVEKPQITELTLTNLNACRKHVYSIVDYQRMNGVAEVQIGFRDPIYRTAICSQESFAENYVGADVGDSGSALLLPTTQSANNMEQMIQVGIVSQGDLRFWLSALGHNWTSHENGNKVSQFFTGMLEYETLSYVDMVSFYYNVSWCARY